MSEAAKYINPIIQSWIHANKNRQDSEEALLRQKADKEHQAQADKHFQLTHDLEKERLTAVQKQQEAVNTMHLADLRARAAQQNVENSSKGLVTPNKQENFDNPELSNAITQTGNIPPELLSSIAQPTSVTQSVPNPFGGPDTNILSAEEIGKNQANIIAPVSDIKQKAIIAEKNADHVNKLDELKQTGANQQAVADTNAASRKYVSDQSYKGLIEKAHLDAAGRIQAAMQKAGKEKPDTSYLAPEITNGTFSIEDLTKIGVKPDERVKLIGDLSKAGVKPLSKEQKAFAAAGGAITSFREAIANLNTQYEKHGMLSGFSPDVTNAKQEVTAQLGNIARVIGGERGAISNKDTERALGLAPNTLNAIIGGDRNALKLQQFDKILDNRFNTLFGNLKDEQKELVRNTWQIPTSSRAKSFEGTRLRNGEVVDASGTVTGRWK